MMPRYIDADDFLDLFYVASAGQDKAFVRTVEMVVEDTPTADVEPMRHGKWSSGILDFSCSACGVYQNMYTGKSKYCPNCGAKMDEK